VAKLIPYDVTGVEESAGGTGVKVKPGVHVARIVKCVQREEKRDGSPANDIEVALNVGDEYDWVFTYIGLSDSADWKLAEFIRALGLKETGKLDPEKQVGKLLRVKINSGEYEGNYSPQAGRLMKAQKGDEELFGQRVSEGSTQQDEPEPDDEPEGEEPAGDKTYADPNFVASREGEEDVGSYDDWSEEDLLAECEDRGVTLPGGRGSKKNKAIQALRDEDAEVSGASADDEDEPEAEADGEDEYDDWDLDQLKEEWESRDMGDIPSFRGRNAGDRVKAAMIEQLRADDAENPFEA
jgi:hypothetical protein